MPLDPNRPDLLLGVIGTGAMGRGIVQVAAAGGHAGCPAEKHGVGRSALPVARSAAACARMAEAGLRRTHWWTDPAGDFGLSLSTK